MNILQGIAFIGGPIMGLIIVAIVIDWVRFERKLKKSDYILPTKLGYSKEDAESLRGKSPVN